LIFEHRPDRLAEVQDVLRNFVNSHDDLIVDIVSKQEVRFGHVDGEGLPRGEGWTRSGRLVLFEFIYYPDRLDLLLYVGPRPTDVRRRFIELAIAHPPPYRVSKRGTTETQRSKSIFSRRFLRADDFEDATLAEIEARIRDQ